MLAGARAEEGTSKAAAAAAYAKGHTGVQTRQAQGGLPSQCRVAPIFWEMSAASAGAIVELAFPCIHHCLQRPC